MSGKKGSRKWREKKVKDIQSIKRTIVSGESTRTNKSKREKKKSKIDRQMTKSWKFRHETQARLSKDSD